MLGDIGLSQTSVACFLLHMESSREKDMNVEAKLLVRMKVI